MLAEPKAATPGGMGAHVWRCGKTSLRVKRAVVGFLLRMGSETTTLDVSSVEVTWTSVSACGAILNSMLLSPSSIDDVCS